MSVQETYAYIAIRRSTTLFAADWMQLSTLAATSNESRDLAIGMNDKLPEYAKIAPIVRIARVQLVVCDE